MLKSGALGHLCILKLGSEKNSGKARVELVNRSPIRIHRTWILSRST